MKVTQRTKDAHAERRFAEECLADGYEEIQENGHPLWELSRGDRTDCVILDACVSPLGRSVWIKIGRIE
jgi:hypothetical protein